MDHHEKILKDIHENIDENEEYKERKPHRWIFSIFAFFVLLTLILYFTSGPFGLSSIIGLIGSSEIENNNLENYYEIELKNGKKILLKDKTYDQLKQIFNEDPINEFKVCLIGRYDGDYHVDSISKPNVHDESLMSVTAESCPQNTIIPLHSHPFNNCVPSETDKKSQQYFKQINENSIGGIMCGIDRFVFYG